MVEHLLVIIFPSVNYLFTSFALFSYLILFLFCSSFSWILDKTDCRYFSPALLLAFWLFIVSSHMEVFIVNSSVFLFVSFLVFLSWLNPSLKFSIYFWLHWVFVAVRAFSSWWAGLLLVVGLGLLTAVILLPVAEHRLRGMRVSAVGAPRLGHRLRRCGRWV